MANDRFGERIILINKEKVCSSTNAKSDEFHRKIITLNILSLWSYKEIVSHATDAICHGNSHSHIANPPDISLSVKHMTDDSIFYKKLSCTDI